MSDKKIVGFKKFTDIKSKPEVEEVKPSNVPISEPVKPNVPKESKKTEKPMSNKGVVPTIPSEDVQNESVETIGRIAKFPKNTKASNAFNFLENVKVSKKSIWYIMVEKMDNELQMVKYNVKEGVDLNKFVNELKTYYTKKYSTDPEFTKSILNIKVDGTINYSIIKNIPLIEVEGKKLITKITEDLIKLLSK